MKFHFWYTGKAVVLASLKAGTQYMRWAYRQSPNWQEWYGTLVKLNDYPNELEVISSTKYKEIVRSFKNSTEEEEFILNLLKDEQIPILIFRRDPKLKFISGVAQALGAGEVNYTWSAFKTAYPRDYKYLTSIIKRKKLIEPNVFYYDIEFARDFNGQVFHMSNKLIHKVFFNKPGFMVSYKKLIKFALLHFIDGIFKDPHVLNRSDLVAIEYLKTREKAFIDNRNIKLLNLDSTDFIRQHQILHVLDIAATDDLRFKHSQIMFREIVEKCIEELPEGIRKVYMEAINTRLDDSRILDEFENNSDISMDKIRISKLNKLS